MITLNETTKTKTIEIDGFELDIDITFEFTISKGYPATWDEPGVDEEIEIILNESRTIESIIKECSDLVDIEKEGIVIDFGKVLDDIQQLIDADDILHQELYEDARNDYLSDHGDYLYEQKKDREMEETWGN